MLGHICDSYVRWYMFSVESIGGVSGFGNLTASLQWTGAVGTTGQQERPRKRTQNCAGSSRPGTYGRCAQPTNCLMTSDHQIWIVWCQNASPHHYSWTQSGSLTTLTLWQMQPEEGQSPRVFKYFSNRVHMVKCFLDRVAIFLQWGRNCSPKLMFLW